MYFLWKIPLCLEGGIRVMPSSLLSFLCPEDLLCQHINNDWSLPSAMLTCSSPSLFLNFYYWAFPIFIGARSTFCLNFYFWSFSMALDQASKPLCSKRTYMNKKYLKIWRSIAKPENNNCSKAFREAVLETQHELVADSRRADHPSPRILREQLIQVKKL